MNEGPTPPGLRATAWLKEADDALRHHGLVIFLASLVFALGQLLALAAGRELTVFSSGAFLENYVLLVGTWVLAAVTLLKFIHMIFVARLRNPLQEMARWLFGRVFTFRRFANGFLGVLTFYLLMSGFSFAKNAIPGFGGFRWDPELAALGLKINFGYRAFELIEPFLGYPVVTVLIDKVYMLWFPVLFASFFIASFGNERSVHRHRFILSMILAWSLGGIVLATIFASAGPVYFDKVTDLPSPYVALFRYLAKVNAIDGLDAFTIREQLWQAFTGHPSVSMISSFPSMHVTAATIIALACYCRGGVVRIGSIVFAAVIFLGSIHLGWHYSVDSYAGLLIAAAAWSISAPLSHWYFRKTERSTDEQSKALMIPAG